MASVFLCVRPLSRLRAIPSCVSHRFASQASIPARGSAKTPSRPSSQTPVPRTESATTPPALKVPAPGEKLPKSNSVASQTQGLPLKLANKQYYAEKIYAGGQTAIFRPPSHTGIYAVSWLMGGSSLTAAALLAWSNISAWGFDANLHWIVPVAHVAGIIAFSAIGWVLLLRSTRFLNSIDLVSVAGIVKLAVQVRRPLPFMSPKTYLMAPYEFEMDKKFVRPMEFPDFMYPDEIPEASEESAPPKRDPLSYIARSISRAIYIPFASTRRLLTLEGFMIVNFPGSGGKMKLDVQGYISNAGTDLVKMGTIKD